MTENAGFFFHMVKLTVQAGVAPRKIAAKLGVSVALVESWLENRNAPEAELRSRTYRALSELVQEAGQTVQANVEFALGSDEKTAEPVEEEPAAVGDLCYLPYGVTAFEYIRENNGIGDRIPAIPVGSYVVLIGKSRGMWCVKMDTGALVWVTGLTQYHSFKKNTPKSGGWY